MEFCRRSMFLCFKFMSNSIPVISIKCNETIVVFYFVLINECEINENERIEWVIEWMNDWMWWDVLASNSPWNNRCARRKLHNLFANLKVIVKAHDIRFVIPENARSIDCKLNSIIFHLELMQFSSRKLTAILRSANPNAIVAHNFPCRAVTSSSNNAIECNFCAWLESFV